jgi:hypothetical protein
VTPPHRPHVRLSSCATSSSPSYPAPGRVRDWAQRQWAFSALVAGLEPVDADRPPVSDGLSIGLGHAVAKMGPTHRASSLPSSADDSEWEQRRRLGLARHQLQLAPTVRLRLAQRHRRAERTAAGEMRAPVDEEGPVPRSVDREHHEGQLPVPVALPALAREGEGAQGTPMTPLARRSGLAPVGKPSDEARAHALGQHVNLGS